MRTAPYATDQVQVKYDKSLNTTLWTRRNNTQEPLQTTAWAWNFGCCQGRFNGHNGFDAAFEVAFHEISGADVVFLLATVPEIKDPGHGWEIANANILTDNAYETCDPNMGATNLRVCLCNISPCVDE